MDARLAAKAATIEAFAHDCGWDTERLATEVDGMEAVQVIGTTVRGHPEAPHPLDFGFMVAFVLNPETNRVSALRLDGKPNAALVVTVEDGTDRYWYGPLSAHKWALDDPEAWTGVQAPAPVSR